MNLVDFLNILHVFRVNLLFLHNNDGIVRLSAVFQDFTEDAIEDIYVYLFL